MKTPPRTARTGAKSHRTRVPQPKGPPHESVDMVNRPGPGELEDAEKPGSPRDPEEQSGGRSVEEELVIQPNEDDAGGLPNQQVANRGAQQETRGRDVPETHFPLKK